jgi:cyclohexa-1,5-dienecarbonyl-CoA hydratase
MKKAIIRYTHDESIARIELNDGKGNILDHIMMEQLGSAFSGFKRNSQLKLVVFEGSNGNFSFGASVEEHKKEYAAVMLRTFHNLFFMLRDLAVPTLAKISGQCLGGGFELALMCNFLVADRTAKFGQPEVILGLFPPPASILLPEKIGLARAEELLITGRKITADEAFEKGLLMDVHENREEMDSKTEEWISSHILPKSASSLRFAVRSSRIKFNHVISNFLPQLENLYINSLMETHDANEGILSFIEKRKPVWNNR